jgi:carboxypeptidase Taq
VLNWDQATYMPEGGAGDRGRQLATLYRLAHERMVAPALGTLIDALAHHGESLPYDERSASSTASSSSISARRIGSAMFGYLCDR